MPDLAALQPQLEAFARTLAFGPIRAARHAPDPAARPTECFANARRQAREHGGKAVFGWMFLHRLISNISDAAYLVAVHHAVWQPAGAGGLVDVTPFHDDPRQQPLAPGGEVLFLIDNEAYPVVTPKLVGPRPSRFFALGDDPRHLAHVAKLEEEERAACRAIYGNAVPL